MTKTPAWQPQLDLGLPSPERADLCGRCLVHEATVTRAISVLDYAHGHSQRFCECCNLKADISEGERYAAMVPKWRAQLKKACADEPQLDADELLVANEELRVQLHHQWQMAHQQFCVPKYYNKPGEHHGPPPEGVHCYWPMPGILEGT